MSNPYASPTPIRDDALSAQLVVPGAEQLRQQRLKDEVTLCRCTYGVTLLGCLPIAAIAVLEATPGSNPVTVVVLQCFLVANMLLGIACCVGVTGHWPWARRPTILLAILTLPFFPIGTGIGLEMLRVLFAGPEPKLLTPGYRQVIIETPQRRPRTSFMTKLALFLLLVLFVCIGVIVSMPEVFRPGR